MIEITPSSWKYPPLSYQLQGVKDLVRHPLYALFWEMRLRKSKVILDTAGTLYSAGQLEVLLIVCPAQVKDVWLGKQYGEIVKHSWVPTKAMDYDGKIERSGVRQYMQKGLLVIVTSLEYLRQEDENNKFPKVEALLEALHDLTCWLVIDEASAVGNQASLQTRAVMRLRKKAQRVTLLDGTPSNGTLVPIFSKFKILDPMILCLKNSKEFKYKYCVVKRVREGRTWTDKVIGHQNLEDLWAKTAPYCHRLEQKDVKGILDMPELIPGELTCRLNERSWSIYKQMRDEMLASLESGEKSWATQASTKILRLAQICSGFLGGVEGQEEAREIGDESLDAVVQWFWDRLDEDPNFKCVIWCRWRPEIARLVKVLEGAKKAKKIIPVDYLVGQQWGDKKDENFLHPDHPYQGPGVMICQQQAVQYGVSFAKAPVQLYVSQDYNLILRLQSEQRVQDEIKKLNRDCTLSLDLLVSGPQGQRTVMHDIVEAQRTKEDVSRRLSARWKKVLKDE